MTIRCTDFGSTRAYAWAAISAAKRWCGTTRPAGCDVRDRNVARSGSEKENEGTVNAAAGVGIGAGVGTGVGDDRGMGWHPEQISTTPAMLAIKKVT